MDGSGNSIVWENLKLTEITDVILHYEDGEAAAEIKNGEQPGVSGVFFLETAGGAFASDCLG